MRQTHGFRAAIDASGGLNRERLRACAINAWTDSRSADADPLCAAAVTAIGRRYFRPYR
jgi:hypothetical protein